MKKVYWLNLLLLMLPKFLQAQYDRILNNPNVIWAAEIDVLYDLQPLGSADTIKRNDFILWKNFDGQNVSPHENGELLIEKLLQAVRAGYWPAWQYADSVRQLSKAEVISRLDEIDTIEAVDVQTGMRILKPVVNEADPASFRSIRVKQLLYYDQKKGDFELYTSAIAPVRRVSTMTWNRQDEWVEEPRFDYTPFWVKMPEYSKKANQSEDVNDANISWAAQFKTVNNIPEIDSLRTFKDFKPPVMQVLLDRFHFDRNYTAQNAVGQFIPFANRNELLTSTDTVVTFDPETYEEKMVIVRSTSDDSEIQRLRLVENWFWDDRRHRLYIQLAGFAPMMHVKDNEGNIRFDSPLFYRWKKKK